MDLKQILSQIPEFPYFYTVDELTTKGKELADRYPDRLERFSVGRSREGDPIWCLKVGSGTRKALCFACPHPNEPIGSLTLLTLAELLAKDSALEKELDFTWFLIPCIDPDGTRLNESWFKGPFTIENYARGFYRPPGNKQVEWTFPFSYGQYTFDSPLPETVALMDLIREHEPSFVFSLHNLAFGGAYWYLSDNIPALCEQMEEVAQEHGIMLHLGEAESPYIKKWSKAVYDMMSLNKYFTYLEKKNALHVVKNLDSGTCSGDFIASVCKSLVLMAEVPYFIEEKIADESDSDLTYVEVLKLRKARQDQHYQVLKDTLGRVKELLSEDNPFPQLVFGMMDHYEHSDVQEPSGEARKATVAEKVDNLYLSSMFELLNLGMAIRACDHELMRQPEAGSNPALLAAREALDQELIKQSAYLETHTDYKVVPIDQLVKVQLASALLAVRYA